MNTKYPLGKLREDDEGQVPIGIRVENGTVIIDFFKPMRWIGMDKQTALDLANALIKHAESIRVN